MATKLRFQPHISVITAYGDPYSLLFITISVFPWFPSGWDGGFASLNTPAFSATVEGSRTLAPMPDILLSLPKVSTLRWEACKNLAPVPDNLLFPPMVSTLRWEASRTVFVASGRIPPKLTISFWGRSSWGGTEMVKIGVKEATFCGIPKVRRQAFLCYNLN